MSSWVTTRHIMMLYDTIEYVMTWYYSYTKAPLRLNVGYMS